MVAIGGAALVCAVLLSVWWMGRRLYGTRVALAAALVAGLFPRFFLVSGQFRTDDMWTALWLASLAMIVGAPWRHWRWLMAGFRMRPYYPVIESLAIRRFRHGLMQDTISTDLIEHRTMLVIRERLPPVSDAFVLRNYLFAGDDVWIAGRQLTADATAHNLRIELPGDYTLVDGAHAVSARVDGQAVTSHWELSPGAHRFTTSSRGTLYLVWTQAWERGWRPALPGST